MLKSIYEGYIPSIVIAIIGFNTLGGSVLAWLAFVWLFGAVATVGVAYARSALSAPKIETQTIGAMENC